MDAVSAPLNAPWTRLSWKCRRLLPETYDLEGTINEFREVTPGGKPFKKAYVALMLWFVGRVIQAAGRVDREVKKEFEKLPEGFTFCLGVMSHGPYMIVGKNHKGRVEYMGWRREGRFVDLDMKIKNIEAAILMFTFQESTVVTISRDRMVVDGEVPMPARLSAFWI